MDISLQKIIYSLFLISLHHPSLVIGDEWYTETLYDSWRQTFRLDEIIYEEKTPEQHLVIFKNKLYGNVLALDGVIQITDNDESVYQEMMSHVPLLAHGNAHNVLIIGGGDGGILREVLRHKTVKKVTLVEIDESVVHFSKKYLPNISKGSFDNPRLQLIIQDGAVFVKSTNEKFDVIICDSTDPEGPAAVLFTSEFYGDCHRALSEGGIFVNQNGVPFLQMDELLLSLKNRKTHFKEVGFYLGVIPTYVGGFMAFGLATDKKENLDVSVEALEKRLQNIEGELKYYTPALHKASFALPKFIEDAIKTDLDPISRSH